MTEEEKEETYEEPVAKFPITTSLEPCKSKYFSGDIDGFRTDLLSENFKIFCGNYRYSDDYEGRPTFVVNNLLNGFVNQLEDKRKYLFTAFRYTKPDDKYNITSCWITNCTIPLQELIPDKYDDFVWTKIEITNLNTICDDFFKKNSEDENIIYLH